MGRTAQITDHPDTREKAKALIFSLTHPEDLYDTEAKAIAEELEGEVIRTIRRMVAKAEIEKIAARKRGK